MQDELVKLNKLDEDLESKELISSQLGDLIMSIANKKTDRETFKEDHDAYIQAQGALDALGNETEIQYKLKQIKNEIDNHVANIKLAIEQDPHLSSDITEDELRNRIDDLKQKNEEYNQYKGFIQNKQSLMAQMDSIKEDIGMSINQIDIIENKINVSAFNQEKYEQILSNFEEHDSKREALSSELSEIKGQARESIKIRNVSPANMSLTLRVNVVSALKMKRFAEALLSVKFKSFASELTKAFTVVFSAFIAWHVIVKVAHEVENISGMFQIPVILSKEPA